MVFPTFAGALCCQARSRAPVKGRARYLRLQIQAEPPPLPGLQTPGAYRPTEKDPEVGPGRGSPRGARLGVCLRDKEKPVFSSKLLLAEAEGCAGNLGGVFVLPGAASGGRGDLNSPACGSVLHGWGGWRRRARAHRTRSPIRIYCLTSRLPEIGCSDVTLGSTGEKLFKRLCCPGYL